jgi:hypothetical protein
VLPSQSTFDSAGGKACPIVSGTLEPVEVAALFDFRLTLRHLKNSGETIGKSDEGHGQRQPTRSCLVTDDEVGDPYSLKVTVLVNGHVKYQGSTSEISHKAEDVFGEKR